jgi:hypothetical protein
VGTEAEEELNMNPQQLAKIEARWLAASQGPWCVDDFRGMGSDEQPLKFEDIASNCRLVYPMTRRKLEEGRAKVDKMIYKSAAVEAKEPQAAFAILGANQDGFCGDADLELLIHAPEDIGVLVSEVRKLEAKVEALTAAMLAAQEGQVAAMRTADAATKALAKFREVARAVLEASS